MSSGLIKVSVGRCKHYWHVRQSQAYWHVRQSQARLPVQEWLARVVGVALDQPTSVLRQAAITSLADANSERRPA